jgi:hypothetical protein
MDSEEKPFKVGIETMNDKKYVLVRDGTIKTYDDWVKDHQDKYAGKNRKLAELNINFMIMEKWLVESEIYHSGKG